MADRDYKLLAEGLRYCSKHICNKECGYYEICHRDRGKEYPSVTSVGFDAADAIEELLDELTTIRKQLPHWISVEDELPEESGYTIVYCTDGHINHRTFSKYQKQLKRWDLTGARSYWRVTHWMPLPSPPKGVE